MADTAEQDAAIAHVVALHDRARCGEAVTEGEMKAALAHALEAMAKVVVRREMAPVLAAIKRDLGHATHDGPA